MELTQVAGQHFVAESYLLLPSRLQETSDRPVLVSFWKCHFKFTLGGQTRLYNIRYFCVRTTTVTRYKLNILRG